MNTQKGKKGFVKGASPWNKGKKMPYEITDMARQNKSNICRNTVIYNNGEREIRLLYGEEIPEGFVKGRLISDEGRKNLSESYTRINEIRWGNKERDDNGESKASTDK